MCERIREAEADATGVLNNDVGTERNVQPASPQAPPRVLSTMRACVGPAASMRLVGQQHGSTHAQTRWGTQRTAVWLFGPTRAALVSCLRAENQ